MPQLAEALDTTARSVYRYLQLLEEVGYLIDKDDEHHYFLMQPYDDQVQQLFTTEEAYFLQDLLQQVGGREPITEVLLAKLNRSHALIPQADRLPEKNQLQHIQTLTKAIQLRYRVRLCNYHSASSGTIADREVEPIQFMHQYKYLLAFDVHRQENRQFKLDRMSKVEWLNQRITTEHSVQGVDAFGFTGSDPIEVELQLTAHAYRLLVEEYPLTRENLTKQSGQAFLYRGSVRDFRGVSRFILGLPGQVEVRKPRALLAFLRKQIDDYTF